MSVYAPLVGNLWLTLESYGYDPEKIIGENLYRPGRSNSADERIGFENYEALLARVSSTIPDPAVGLRAAELIHPSHLGALGYAWLASSTLRTAIRRAQRYSRMYNEALVMKVEERPDRLTVSYYVPSSRQRPHAAGDAQLAILLKLCRINFGPALQPIEVLLSRPRPADPTPWIDVFGPHVEFDSGMDSLSISATDANAPLTGSNEALVALNEDVINRYLLKLDRANVLNRARLAIMERLPSGGVTQDDIAQMLNISRRTLHRKLQSNGETFRSLVRQVRKDLARTYIANDNYSVTEIAFLLGFSDASAFSRAFKDWFGQSPTKMREIKLN